MSKSLRFRLAAWHVGFFAVLLVLFCVFVYNLLARSLMARLDDKLASQAGTAAVLLEDEFREMGGDLPKAAAETVFEMGVGGSAIAIVVDGSVLSGGLKTNTRRSTRRVTLGGRAVEVVSAEMPDPIDSELRVLRGVLFVGLPLFLLLAGLGGHMLTTRHLAPLESMAAQARRIGGANLQTRLEIGDAADELAVLAASFNDLLARLDQSFDSMRRFVADASHELRTPLAIIRAEADVALSRERESAEYREALSIVLEESRRLSRLIDDLLNLARADAGSVKLQLREFYFNDLLADCCRSAQSLAMARSVTLECRTAADVPFSGDEELLRRLTMNLLDNAIRYTPASGSVTASLESESGGIRLRVADTGIGISPDAAPHVFERFFRADKARSRADGGFGLGLSIVKWIAESHHGTVEVESLPTAGSTFTVSLPR